MLRHTIRDAFRLIRPTQRTKGGLILSLLMIQSLLDFLGLLSFLPLFGLIINPDLQDRIGNYGNVFPALSQQTLLIALTLAVLLFVLIKNWLGLLIAKTKAKFIYNVAKDLSARAIEAYTRRNYNSFSKTDFSREVNIIANYPFVFATNIITPIATLISETLVATLILIGLIILDFRIPILLLLLAAPLFLLYRSRKKKLAAVRDTLKEQYPLLLKNSLQLIEGLMEIKSSAKEHYFIDKQSGPSAKLSEAYVRDHVTQTGTTRITEIVATFIICGLILYTTLATTHYQDTIFMLSIYASASFRIIPSINRILLSILQFRTHDHVIAILGEATKADDTIKSSPAESVPLFNRQIRLQNISARYAGGPWILRNANITLNKGDRIALTGKSGEGKSTLLLVLLGLLETEEGEFFIDDVAVGASSLRDLIAYVPQNPYILDASLIENIALGIPEQQIDRLKITKIIHELRLNDLVALLPEGMDQGIGERGVKLSGGQQQRLAIARALYCDKEILLFDESMNQIHESLEKEILDLVSGLSLKGKTVLMITHKTHNASFFDTVYTLDKGSFTKVNDTVTFSDR
ncbi:ATP-binding cassette domain-containing protein [Pseudochryseolinea flava]|uniref:ABC transporter ATP-binding protein n=1 Tax=Pseudochryseolinea flava TaxID=2059302 RepID=A0A364Y6Z3_9BACT|nr:ABC transporter ATP-binding protein [Pseudochryseolinea flava]RAW02747.1 hypothetical protein DQQ10_01165 [Pseudochryseolinea flava]